MVLCKDKSRHSQGRTYRWGGMTGNEPRSNDSAEESTKKLITIYLMVFKKKTHTLAQNKNKNTFKFKVYNILIL